MLPVSGYSEHISIFRIYFQSIINSVMTSDDIGTIQLGKHVKRIHANELVWFDILVALRFVDVKELEKLINNLPCDLPLSNDALEYLHTVIKNCTQRSLCRDVFWKCMIILGHCNLNEEIIETVLNKLNELIIPFDYHEFAACIVKLITNAHKQNAISACGIACINALLETELQYIISNKEEANSHHSTVLTMLWALKENNELFNNCDLIFQLISNETKLLCVSMYPLLGNQAKQIVYDEYHNWKFESNYFGFEFYYYLVNEKIIDPCAEAENHILDYYAKKTNDA